MDSFKVGDRIQIQFVGSSEPAQSFTVCATLSDQQEGLSPESEDYVACWLEVSEGDCASSAKRHAISFGTDFKYSMDGRYVTINKVTN